MQDIPGRYGKPGPRFFSGKELAGANVRRNKR